MNAPLRNRLSAIAVSTGLLALGFAFGEPPRPGAVAMSLGSDAVVALQASADDSARADDKRDAERDDNARASRLHLAMPFFSFGKRANAGIR